MKNSVTVCKKTLEYSRSKIYETEYVVLGPDGGAPALPSHVLARLAKEVIEAGVYSVELRAGAPMVIRTRRAAGSDQEDLVASILSRYCIRGGFLQDEWLARHQHHSPPRSETPT